MEQYLKEDYGVLESEYVKDVGDLKDYFEDVAVDLMECGQGYYTDEAVFMFKIGDKFYEVFVGAAIMSAKQDRGDRLYWIDYVEEVTATEIEKPKPKGRTKYEILVNATDEELAKIQKSLREICFAEYTQISEEDE